MPLAEYTDSHRFLIFMFVCIYVITLGCILRGDFNQTHS